MTPALPARWLPPGSSRLPSGPPARPGNTGVAVPRPAGARLKPARDGTFTATGLTAGIGDWNIGPTPVSGGATWHVGRFEASAPPWVIFDFSDGSQAELQLETAGATLAMHYDRGDPDEGWSGQYRFVEQ